MPTTSTPLSNRLPQLAVDPGPPDTLGKGYDPTTPNRWQLGVMYELGLVSGQPFFTQPAGPGTPVFPTQQNAQPWPEYPIPGLVIQEYNPWWSPGCGHSIKMWKVVKEWDYVTGQDCALICCEICTYVQAVYEPFSEWLEPITHAIIVA